MEFPDYSYCILQARAHLSRASNHLSLRQWEQAFQQLAQTQKWVGIALAASENAATKDAPNPQDGTKRNGW